MGKVPKYAQIENYLIDKINSGKLKIGDQIETEEELVELFGFSRMTVNKALNRLAEQDYITRTPGKGSFVKATHVIKSLEKHYSFTEDMKDIGLVAGSNLITYRLIMPKEVAAISKKIDINDEVPLHYFERLRTGSGKPIAISYNYVSSEVLPDLSIDALNYSFYDYLRSKGYTLLGSSTEIEAVLPSEKHKRLLQIETGAILKTKVTTSVLHNDVEKVLGYFETFYNGNLYTYKFNN